MNSNLGLLNKYVFKNCHHFELYLEDMFAPVISTSLEAYVGLVVWKTIVFCYSFLYSSRPPPVLVKRLHVNAFVGGPCPPPSPLELLKQAHAMTTHTAHPKKTFRNHFSRQSAHKLQADYKICEVNSFNCELHNQHTLCNSA
jgi:hypothetical protein